MGLKDKSERQRQRDFYKMTQKNATMGRRDLQQPIKKNIRTKPTSEWRYKGPTIAVFVAIELFVPLIFQYFIKVWMNLGKPALEQDGFWHYYGCGWVFILWVLLVGPGISAYIGHRFKAIWTTNNAEYLSVDIEPYANDAYVRTIDHVASEFDAAPDAGLGFDGHVSSIVGHMMVSNKGIKKIDMPLLDPNREGQVAVDKHGKPITKQMDMFDKSFGRELYKFSNVPGDSQRWYDATDYAFNEKNDKKEAKYGNARKGAFGRKAYDTLADYINGEFYPLPTDTQRPAGVYFYDSRPVNTILIAITRGGKGKLARLVG